MLAVTLTSYIATGLLTREALPMLAIVLPSMLVPSFLGTRLYLGISEATFRRLVLMLLTASGVTLLGSAVSRWL